jgi:hypothetical protein
VIRCLRGMASTNGVNAIGSLLEYREPAPTGPVIGRAFRATRWLENALFRGILVNF